MEIDSEELLARARKRKQESKKVKPGIALPKAIWQEFLKLLEAEKDLSANEVVEELLVMFIESKKKIGTKR